MRHGLECLCIDLRQGRTTSYMWCKICGHTFHGSATRIKEYFFGIGENVERCPTPPSDIYVCLQNFVSKLKSKGISQPNGGELHWLLVILA